MRPSPTLAEELAEREGFELGEAVSGISKLLIEWPLASPLIHLTPHICHQICHHTSPSGSVCRHLTNGNK